MFVHYTKELKKPIKIWLEDRNAIDENCLEQAEHLAQLPFIHKWVCLMPDTHAGKGMPIGGVIATKGVIIPNAVGVDIGCGMNFVDTNIKLDDIKDIQTGSGSIVQNIISGFMRSIPVATARHKDKQASPVLDKAKEEWDKYEANPELLDLIEDGYYQVGTLGGGNHFLELQVDDDGYLCLMIHSGSRHLSEHQRTLLYYQIVLFYSQVPDEWRLAFLPVDSVEGKQYINWMKLAMDYAFENRKAMMDKACEIVKALIEKYTDKEVLFGQQINCHHNYAAIENHFGENVWVHRKGANRARVGDMAVIPGAMGSYSYVVEGKGNVDSFCSSSHGAGRAYSRSGAKNAFTVEQVMLDLKAEGVVLGKASKNDVAEECRFAYKDIDVVMENQKDLVTPLRRLKTVGVLKG